MKILEVVILCGFALESVSKWNSLEYIIWITFAGVMIWNEIKALTGTKLRSRLERKILDTRAQTEGASK